MDEHVTRIMTTRPCVTISLANVLTAFSRIVFVRIRRRTAPELDPMNFELPRVVISVPRVAPSRIIIKHWAVLWQDDSLTEESPLEE